MAQYFSKFPKIYHSFDDFKTSEKVVNILTRFSLEESLKENSSIFYEYVIRDGDTPEIIASKVYNSSERHWIVLMMNDIIDPRYEWPLQYEVLNKYIDAKYLPEGGDPGDGIIWARANIHSYYRVESVTSPNGITTTRKYQVDANTYTDTAISLNDNVTLADSSVAVFDTNKETKTYYEYEMEENESKRNIKLLKQQFVSQLEIELKNLT